MANNIPGVLGYIQPTVVVRNRVKQSVNAVGGGLRVPLIMGEGLTEETLVSSALGGGADGVNADYSGSNSPDGRHFQISQLDLVDARTSILKNGVPLSVLEAAIDTNAFDSRFDCRVDPATGRVELQRSHLVDFGNPDGSTLYFQKYAANVGTGTPTLSTASLVDSSAPSETWTIRCVSVVRDSLGDPIPGQATFSVTGSISGAKKDSVGNVISWKSNGTVVSNGILSFAISEGSTPFNVGDRFTARVSSGVLNKGDSLSARYIPNANLNDPELFFTPADLFAKHGEPSETNTLSLGAMMAFENGAPAVFALQCKPPVPRRTADVLLAADNPLTVGVEGATGDGYLADTVFAMAPGALPDVDSKINIFILNADGTEEQVLLDKVDFYNTAWTTTASVYSNFVTGPYTNSYTVISAPQVEQEGSDGYVYTDVDGYVVFDSDTVSFSVDLVDAGESDLDKQIVIYDLIGNLGTYSIDEIGDGYGDMSIAKITLLSGTAMSGTGLRWQVVDPADTGTFFALSDDVVATYLTSGKGLRVEYVSTADAGFFDTNWASAYEAAELADAQFIVPLPTQTISNIFATGKSHVIEMSNLVNARERVLIIGAIKGLTPNNLIGVESAAVENIGLLEGIQGDDPEEVLDGNIEDLANYSVPAAYGDTNRVIYIAPDEIIRNIAGTNTSLSGYFLAPALAGFLAGQTNLAEPPTYKTLSGFNIPRTKTYRPSVLNSLGQNGILILQPVAGGGRMLHGLTTAQSRAPEDEEISIVGIRDQVVRSLRASLQPFIGRVNTPTAVAEISGGVDKLMRAFISQGLLTGYSDLSVSRDPVEPRQINIAVKAAPASPINWVFVDIEFSLG